MKLLEVSAVLAAVMLSVVAGCAGETTDEQQQPDEKEAVPAVDDSKLTPQSCAPPGTCAQLSRNCRVINSPACNLYFSKCSPPC